MSNAMMKALRIIAETLKKDEKITSVFIIT
jgi:hypothetical protein